MIILKNKNNKINNKDYSVFVLLYYTTIPIRTDMTSIGSETSTDTGIGGTLNET